jgi:GntP family gluconate:H+ symporter
MNLKKLGEVTGSAIPSSADVILVAGAGGAFGGCWSPPASAMP